MSQTFTYGPEKVIIDEQLILQWKIEGDDTLWQMSQQTITERTNQVAHDVINYGENLTYAEQQVIYFADIQDAYDNTPNP